MPSVDIHSSWRAWLRKPHLLLTLIVALQTLLSVRLSNSPFQDEALYMQTGRWMMDSWSGKYVFDADPETYFTGAPMLYPVFAGALDSLGGVGLVRAASLVFMAVSTVLVFRILRLIFDSRGTRSVPLFGTATFAFSTSVLFVGHFATFDAPSYCAALAGFWALAEAMRRPSGIRWAVAAGVMFTFAIFLKYVTAMAVILAVLVVMFSASTPWARRVKCVGTATAIAVGAAAVLLLALGGGDLLKGLIDSTLNREPVQPASAQLLLGKLLDWAWIPALVAVGGFALLVRSRPGLALCLLVGSIAPVGMQVISGEDVSLQKHLVMSMMFAAPLCGYALGRLTQMKVGTPVAAVLLGAVLAQGVLQSGNLFHNWPSTEPLNAAIGECIRNDPNYRILGDNPDSAKYEFYERTQPSQWESTYEGGFEYKGASDKNAYESALRDGYFAMVFLDGYTDLGKQLTPQLEGFGFTKTAEVTETRTYKTWRVYQLTPCERAS